MTSGTRSPGAGAVAQEAVRAASTDEGRPVLTGVLWSLDCARGQDRLDGGGRRRGGAGLGGRPGSGGGGADYGDGGADLDSVAGPHQDLFHDPVAVAGDEVFHLHRFEYGNAV